MKLIDKEKVVAEIYRLDNYWHASKSIGGQAFIESLCSFIRTLKVIDPYAEQIQYDSVKSGIKASSETADEKEKREFVSNGFLECCAKK